MRPTASADFSPPTAVSLSCFILPPHYIRHRLVGSINPSAERIGLHPRLSSRPSHRLPHLSDPIERSRLICRIGRDLIDYPWPPSATLRAAMRRYLHHFPIAVSGLLSTPFCFLSFHPHNFFGTKIRDWPGQVLPQHLSPSLTLGRFLIPATTRRGFVA